MFDAFFGFGDAARDEFVGVGVVGEVDPHLASFVDFEVVFLVEDDEVELSLWVVGVIFDDVAVDFFGFVEVVEAACGDAF